MDLGVKDASGFQDAKCFFTKIVGCSGRDMLDHKGVEYDLGAVFRQWDRRQALQIVEHVDTLTVISAFLEIDIGPDRELAALGAGPDIIKTSLCKAFGIVVAVDEIAQESFVKRIPVQKTAGRKEL